LAFRLIVGSISKPFGAVPYLVFIVIFAILTLYKKGNKKSTLCLARRLKRISRLFGVLLAISRQTYNGLSGVVILLTVPPVVGEYITFFSDCKFIFKNQGNFQDKRV